MSVLNEVCLWPPVIFTNYKTVLINQTSRKRNISGSDEFPDKYIKDFHPGYYGNNKKRRYTNHTGNRRQSDDTTRGNGKRFIRPSNAYDIARIDLTALPDKDPRPANRVRSKSTSNAQDFNHKKHAKLVHHRKLLLKNWAECFDTDESLLASCRIKKQIDRKRGSVACLADVSWSEKERLLNEWATLKSSGKVTNSQRKKGCFMNYTNIAAVSISKVKAAQQKMQQFRIPKKPKPQSHTVASPTGKENLDTSSNRHPANMKSKDAQHATNKISSTTHHSPIKKRSISNKENKMEVSRKDATKHKAVSRAPSTKSLHRENHKDKSEWKKRDRSREAIENINRKLRKCKKLVVVLERIDFDKETKQPAITDAEPQIRAETDDETVGKMISVIDEIPIAIEYKHLLEDLERFSDNNFSTEVEALNTITEAFKEETYMNSHDENNLVIDELRTLSLELADSSEETSSDKVSDDTSKIDKIFLDLLEVARRSSEEYKLDTERVDWSIILGSPPSFENKSAKCVDNDELAIALFKIYEEYLVHEFSFNRNLFDKVLNNSRKPANANFSFEYYVQHQIFSIRFYECLDQHFIQDVDVNVFLKRVFVLSEDNMCVYACCLLRLLDTHVCCRTTFAHNYLSEIYKITSLLQFINPKAFEATIYNKCRNQDDSTKGQFLRELVAFNKRKVMNKMAAMSVTSEDKILRELFCGDPSFGHSEPLMMFASQWTMDEISVTWHGGLIDSPSQTFDIRSGTDTSILKSEPINLCNIKLEISHEVKEASDNGRSRFQPINSIEQLTTVQPVSTVVQKYPKIRAIPLKQLQSAANISTSEITVTCEDMPISATYQELPSTNISPHQLSTIAQNQIKQSQPPAKGTSLQTAICGDMTIIATTYQGSLHQPSVARRASAELSSNKASAHQLSPLTQNHIRQSQSPVKVVTPQSSTCREPIIASTYQRVSAESPSYIASAHQLSAIAPDHIIPSQPHAIATTSQPTACRCSPIIELTYQAPVHQSLVAPSEESPSSNASLHQLSLFTQTHMRQLQPPAKVTTYQTTTSRDMRNISPIYQVSVHQPSVPRRASNELPSNIASAQFSLITQNHMRQLYPTIREMPIAAPLYPVSAHQPSVALQTTVESMSSTASENEMSAMSQNNMRQLQPHAISTIPPSIPTCNEMLIQAPTMDITNYGNNRISHAASNWQTYARPVQSRDVSPLLNHQSQQRSGHLGNCNENRSASTHVKNSEFCRRLEAPVANGHLQAAHTYNSSPSMRRIQTSGLLATPIMTALPSSQDYYQWNQGNHQTVSEELTPVSAHSYYTSAPYSIYGPQDHATGQRGPVNMPPSTLQNTPTIMRKHQTSLPPVLQNPQLHMGNSSGIQNAETATINRRSVTHNSHSHMCQRQPIVQSSRVQYSSRYQNHTGFPNTYNVQHPPNIQDVSSVPNSQTMLNGQYLPVMTNEYLAPIPNSRKGSKQRLATGPVKVKKKKVPPTAANAQRGAASKETIPNQSQLAKEVFQEFVKLLRDNRGDLLEFLSVPTPPKSRLVDSKEVIVIDD